jgi:glycosidase
MVYSLLFSLPGTPVLFYGEEIGMGENLEAEGRLAVRTPMQWTPEPNGGFSTAPPDRLTKAMADGAFGPAEVNVLSQRHDPDSLLSFMRTLAHRYRDCPELGWGEFAVVDQPIRSTLVHTCTWESRTVLAAHNFGAEPVNLAFALPSHEGDVLHDLFGGDSCTASRTGTVELALDGYGYRWFRLSGSADRLI